MTAHTIKAVIDPLLTNVLQIDCEDIKALSKVGSKSYGKLIKLDFTKLETIREMVTSPFRLGGN